MVYLQKRDRGGMGPVIKGKCCKHQDCQNLGSDCKVRLFEQRSFERKGGKIIHLSFVVAIMVIFEQK